MDTETMAEAGTQSANLEITNDSDAMMSLEIEPITCQYLIPPKRVARIVTSLQNNQTNTEFSLLWGPDGIAVYPPDESTLWDATKVYCDGILLKPQ